MEYVSQTEYDRIVAAMIARQDAIFNLTEKLKNARTLAEKVEAQRALKAAKAIRVD